MYRNTDYKTLLQFARNNEAGLRELLNTVEPYVMNKAYYYLGSKQDAEDIFQSVSVKLYENLNTIYPETFKAYLKTITTNACRDVLRKQHKLTDDGYEINVVELDAYQDWDIPSNDKGIDLTDEYRKKIIHEIINSLDEKQREVIVLRYIDEMSVKDISIHLNTPETTIKSRLAAAYKQIEQKVLEVQKRDDIKLYSYSPVLYFLMLLLKDNLSLNTNYQLVNKTMDNISRNIVNTNTDIDTNNTINSNLANNNNLIKNQVTNKLVAGAVSESVKGTAALSLPKIIMVTISSVLVISIGVFASTKALPNKDNNKKEDKTVEIGDADILDNKDDSSVSSYYPSNNYFGLDFLEYGVDEEGYASIFRGIVDCGSNYLESDATYKDIQQFIESGCKITYDEPFRFSNNINAEDLSYKIDNSSSNNNESIVVLDNSKYKIGYQVYLKKDSSDGNYYFEKIIDQYNEFGEQTNIYNKVYLDDNIINLSLFSDLNPGFDVFTNMYLLFPENYQLDSDNNIVSFVVHSYNDGPNPYTATEGINYKDGKIYEVTISGRSRKGSDAQETKFPVEGCINRYTYSGTYRFIYDDLGLLRGIAYVMPEGNLDLLSYFVYYPIDPKPQDLACNIQYNQN